MIRTALLVGATVIAAVATGCGTAPGQCSALTCSGCCQADGSCGTCSGTGGGGGNTGACNVNNCPGCCFNGTCQAGTAANACGKGAATCATCGNNQICRTDQTCGVDPQGMFRVQPVSATITMTDPTDGLAWDPSASPPDVRVYLWCPATAAAMTSSTAEVSDTYTPTWTTGGCVMSASQLLMTGFAMQVVDVDTLSDDPITAKGTLKPDEADFVAGSMSVSGGGLQSMTIQLQRQ